jgi:hypothetical protein
VLADGERAAVNIKRPASSAADTEAEPQEVTPLGRWLHYFGRVREVEHHTCFAQLFSLSESLTFNLLDVNQI